MGGWGGGGVCVCAVVFVLWWCVRARVSVWPSKPQDVWGVEKDEGCLSCDKKHFFFWRLSLRITHRHRHTHARLSLTAVTFALPA